MIQDFKQENFLSTGTKKLNVTSARQIEAYLESDPIEILSLKPRIQLILKGKKIDTVGKLYRCRRKRLKKIKYLGSKSVRYVMGVKRLIRLIKSDTRKNNFYNIISQEIGKKETIKEDDYAEKKQRSYLILEQVSVPEFATRNDSISILELPLRIENALRFHGAIETLGQLCEYNEKDLFKLRNLGPKSIEFLMEIKKKINSIDNLSGAITEESKKSIDDHFLVSEIPNEILIDTLINRCKDPRMIEIIKRRYGLINGEKETLEEIGKIFRVTRERIRQIESVALKKLRHPSVIERKLITEIVEKMLWEKNGIISQKEGDQMISRFFKNIPYDGSSLLDLLGDLGWIDTNDVGDVRFYSPKFRRLTFLPFLMTEIVQILKKSIDFFSAEEITRNLSSQDLFDRNKLALLVARCCRLDPRIEEKTSGKFSLYTYGITKKNVWVSFINKVLKDEGSPLHFTEIADRVNDLLTTGVQHLDHRRAHFILIDNPEFAFSGKKGKYGLIKWGLRKDTTVDLVIESLKKAGYPLHWKQIYSYVHRYKDTKSNNIMAILNNKKRFVKKGVGSYWFK